MNNFKLDNEIKITSGFQIPENYFDQFSDKVMSKLPNQEPKVVSLWSKNKRWIYGIAAILVLLFSIPFANYVQSFSAANEIEIENYLAYHSTISNDDLIELLEEEDIAKIEVANPIDKQTMEEVLQETTEIEEYITY
jgi:hypothetical protein